jgi:nucleoside diphosphate kinase
MCSGEAMTERTIGPEGILESLTVIAAKAALYAQETYFREGWGAITSAAHAGAVEFALRHAGVILRPEAVVSRCLEECCELLVQSGFQPVAAREIRLDRHTTRALWRYKLNIATIARLQLVDLIHESGPCLFVLLRDVSAVERVPAAVRLTSQKGPSDPRRRRQGQIRTRLGVQNRVLNFLHTADEPADLVRELAILFDARELDCVLDGSASRGVSLNEVAQRLYAGQPPHDLSFDASLERVRRAAVASAPSEEERTKLAQVTGSASAPSNRQWGDLAGLVSSMSLPVSRWDLITIGAHLVEPDVAGRRILGDASATAWRERTDRAASARGSARALP